MRDRCLYTADHRFIEFVACVDGIDPSRAQIEFAGNRGGASMARFRTGDAMALPYEDDAFDVAVMALVIFFVPQPEVSIAEMKRTVRPGGTVGTYVWDVHGGGMPPEPVFRILRALAIEHPLPPRSDVSGGGTASSVAGCGIA